MKPLLPGQAAVARHDGKVCIIVCDHRDRLPLGAVDIEVRGGFQNVAVAGVVVPVVIVVLRLSTQEHRFCAAWVNELEENVLESLATQPELPVILASPLGESVGRSPMVNGLRPLAQKQLGPISILADKSPWGPHHFAAARAFIEAQHPAAETLWRVLGGE